MNVEDKIVLDRFKPRWYQADVIDALENKGYKRVLLAWPRRSGKDILSWNIAIRQCLKKVCLIFYILPTYSQARKAIFDAIAIDSTKFIDYIPKQLVDAININEQKIRFKNGSILQCIGGDSYDTSLVGTNPYGVVISEYALMSDQVFAYARPILAANNGWAIICSTPRGKNHYYHLYKLAQELPDWYVSKLTVDDTQHIPYEVLQEERAQMDEGLFQQEYYCSFEKGIEGSIYGRYLDRLRLNGQITHVPWEPGLLTYLSFDIGVKDATTIIWFQVVGDGATVRIIDCYSNNNFGIDHYAKIIQDKPYRYGAMYAPHDIKVREWGAGAITRFEQARQLGLKLTLLDQIPVQDGIENVWMNFNKFWIDENNCRSLIDAIENYRKEWDEKRQTYSDKPVHNWASNYCDALRYMCMALPKTKKGLSSEEFARKRAQALYGNDGLPMIFAGNPDFDRKPW